jgi:hypothetical protein
MKPEREELEGMRSDAESLERSRAFAGSRRAEERWRRARPLGLDAALAWIEELRRLFGDPPVDRRPWRGTEFRL